MPWSAIIAGDDSYHRRPSCLDRVTPYNPALFAHRWGVDLSDMPRIGSIARACAEHPAFVAAVPEAVRPDGGAFQRAIGLSADDTHLWITLEEYPTVHPWGDGPEPYDIDHPAVWEPVVIRRAL